MTYNISKRVSLSLCFEFSIKVSFLIKTGIVTHKRGKLSPITISILITLKLWDKNEEADSDEMQTNFHTIILSSSLLQISKYHR